MKNLVLLFAAFIIATSLKTKAQCSDVKNNFELQLYPTNNKTLEVRIRFGLNEGQTPYNQIPSSACKLDGLIFAIAWPGSSSLTIDSVKNEGWLFNIQTEEKSNQTAKLTNDRLATFYHSATLPSTFNVNWKANEWYNIASIHYSGELSSGDFISLLNCDYGLANPNSYNGNSNTDPWFAYFNEQGEYVQYAPKISTVVPESVEPTAIKTYPNPTSNDLNVEINAAYKTQVAILIYDALGKIIKNVVYPIEKGQNSNVISLGELVAGEYFIKISDGKSLMYSSTIIKQ